MAIMATTTMIAAIASTTITEQSQWFNTPHFSGVNLGWTRFAELTVTVWD